MSTYGAICEQTVHLREFTKNIGSNRIRVSKICSIVTLVRLNFLYMMILTLKLPKNTLENGPPSIHSHDYLRICRFSNHNFIHIRQRRSNNQSWVRVCCGAHYFARAAPLARARSRAQPSGQRRSRDCQFQQYHSQLSCAVLQNDRVGMAGPIDSLQQIFTDAFSRRCFPHSS